MEFNGEGRGHKRGRVVEDINRSRGGLWEIEGQSWVGLEVGNKPKKI